MTAFYVRSRPTTTWVANTAKVLGNRVIATSSSAYLGIHFECTTAGTTHATTEPTWNTTVGGTTADGTVTWTTRGSAAPWVANKAYALGDRVVKTSRTSLTNASSVVWKCTTAGTSHATTEPTWPTTITSGTTTQTDGTVTWTAQACKNWDDAHPFLLNSIYYDQTNTTVKINAGDVIYVGKGHSETDSTSTFVAYTFKPPQNTTVPSALLCVDDTGDPSTPTSVATTAAVTVTGGWNSIAIYNSLYIYGFVFKCGTGSEATGMTFGDGSVYFQGVFEACTFEIASTSSSATIQFGATVGSAASRVKLINCSFKFAAAGQTISPKVNIDWINSTALMAGGTLPTSLITMSAAYSSNLFCYGVDFSAINNASNAIINSGGSYEARFHNCKLHGTGKLISSTPQGTGNALADFINCAATSANYNSYRYWNGVIQTTETTLIRTGGASDGTQGISWKLVSDSSLTLYTPYFTLPIMAWYATTGAEKTATIEILHDSATALKDSEIWVEVEYLGSSSYPISSIASDKVASVLATAADQASSSAAWTTTGMSNPNTQKLTVTFTPQMVGWVQARVYLAKASKTVYIDPVLTIS